MHIHILGICGTFMAGLALLARAAGYRVSGSDANVYPPMSSQLAAANIEVLAGYHAEHLQPRPDLVVVGNAMKRGNPAVEALLDSTIAYTSGPQWLAEALLRERWVLAVAGTHGKTSTSAMLAWILHWADLKPGFLIGGLPSNFGVSARPGDSAFFVVEADEYDSAFFDKRAKFMHYRARTVILNNLEFDHADIYPDLAAIKTQFHHLVRTLPSQGLILSNGDDDNLEQVLSMGCWTPVQRFNQGTCWQARTLMADGSAFEVYLDDALQGVVEWDQLGAHNVSNALAALAAARHVGVSPLYGCQALAEFKGVKRRMEIRGEVAGVTVYDDFAHHPTAIATTLAGLRQRVRQQRIIAVLELRSNTMRQGVFAQQLPAALKVADRVLLHQPPNLDWSLGALATACNTEVHRSVEAIIASVVEHAQTGDHVLIMSNGGFAGIHEKLLTALDAIA